jgi:hypothetical protein
MTKRRKSSTPRVFISHSHKDRHKAVALQKVLEEQKAQTFLDQDRIDAADDLPARVREGIDWCDSMLLLWSASAASSSWVQLEWDMAYDQRKKIIPYVLDSSPLPGALENLVYVESSDQGHGNAQLLTAVLGRDFRPDDPATLFPGLWQASVDALGLVQGAYEFELRHNGQVEGTGGVASTGMAGQMAAQMGMGDLLSMRIPFHGSWTYNQGSQTLTIETSTEIVFGQKQNDTIRIHATGREKGSITGQDLAGRTWKLWRVGERSRSPREDAKQEVRNALQQVFESAKDSPVLAVTLAACCLGCVEKYGHNLGLPTKKARKVMETEGRAFQSAVKEFLHALERGGWIR